MKAFLIFGDSIAYGSEVHFEKAWAHMLAKSVTDADPDVKVFPLGIPGETTFSLLKHLESDVQSHTHHLQKGDRAVVLVGIGANDAKCLGGPDIQVTSPERFQENLLQIKDAVMTPLSGKGVEVTLVFIGLIPVDESLVNPVGEEWFTNARTEKYNALQRDYCGTAGLLFVDLYQSWIKDDYASLLLDGVHPNEQGHARLFEEIIDFLKESDAL